MKNGEALGVPQTLMERQAMHERIYKRGYEAGVDDVQRALSEAEGVLCLPDDAGQIMGEVRRALKLVPASAGRQA